MNLEDVNCVDVWMSNMSNNKEHMPWITIVDNACHNVS